MVQGKLFFFSAFLRTGKPWATTPANVADETLVKPIHADLEEAGLLPSEHLMDAGFVRVEHVVESPQLFGVTIVGPTARDSSWQAHTRERLCQKPVSH